MNFLLVALFATTNPIDFGAIPNDGLDDGFAILLAIDEACSPNGDHLIEFTPGVFHAEKFDALSAIRIECDGLSIHGSGRYATTLVQVPKTFVGSEDYYLLHVINSDGVEISDLTLDGSMPEMIGAEQVHLVMTNASTRLSFSRVTFYNARGDGIKFYQTSDVSVVDCRFSTTGRSGITIHSGVYDARITSNVFENISDQYIDMEGNGSSRITITANTFKDGGNRIKVTLVGGSVHSQDLLFVANTVINGQVQTIYSDSVAIVANALRADGIIPIHHNGDTGKVADVANVITSTSASGQGCISATGMSGRHPKSQLAVANICEHSAGTGIKWDGGPGPFIASDNIIINPGSGNSVGLSSMTTTTEEIHGMVIADNAIINQQKSIHLTSRNQEIEEVAISGNVVHSTKSSSVGFHHHVWNQIGVAYSNRCRGDSNILNVLGSKWIRTGEQAPQPLSNEDCLLHGVAIPP